MRRGAPLVICLLALPGAAQQARGVAVVRLADGAEVPLTSWKLVYEYQTWKQDSGPAFADIQRREGHELIVDKKRLPVAGGQLEIAHRLFEKKDSQGQTLPGAVVTGLTLTSAGKRTSLKPEPPHKDVLANDVKKVFYQARVLDLVGETLTGTRRQLCLMSFSPLVECSAQPGERVVGVEFH
jgi:hypothetical protein